MGRFSFPMSKFDERIFLTLRLFRNKMNICNKYFRKQTQKTPKREIKKAQNLLEDYKKRSKEDE